MPRLIEVHTGAFGYTDASGKFRIDEFHVKTVEAAQGNARITDRRIDDYNDQFGFKWDALEKLGCTGITYNEVLPHPFLGVEL